MTIHCCSSNKGKLREFALAGEESGYSAIPFVGLEIIKPPEEHGSTFEENASAKALYYSSYANGIVLADDSGLEVDALYGAPGIYSARYAGPGATDQDNINLLLRNLGNVTARSARFVCVAALAQQGKLLGVARGHVEGEITCAPRGSNGFGYDPVFFYPPAGRTFSELKDREKLLFSHRGRAVRELLRSAFPSQ